MTPLLAQRLRADRSFERIYNRHAREVYRYSLAVLNNPADAEDVTQTTFLNAYRAIQRGERPLAPERWLIKIAHNVCRQRFRQASRRIEEVVLDDNVGDAASADEGTPTAEDIRRALSHLAFNQRAALVMRELEGRSYAEIADVLGVSVSAVETLIFRARRALREQLEGRLTCAEAERAISKQLDGELGRKERGTLRAHLRECDECARLARKQRAQRVAIKALGFVPLPPGLASLSAGGAVATATVGTKAAAVVAAGLVATGITVEGSRHVGSRTGSDTKATPARAVEAAPAGAVPQRAAPRRAPVVADRLGVRAHPVVTERSRAKPERGRRGNAATKPKRQALPRATPARGRSAAAHERARANARARDPRAGRKPDQAAPAPRDRTKTTRAPLRGRGTPLPNALRPREAKPPRPRDGGLSHTRATTPRRRASAPLQSRLPVRRPARKGTTAVAGAAPIPADVERALPKLAKK